jgi:hypothetical protein
MAVNYTPEMLATMPAVSLPDGVTYNLVNSHSEGPKLIIAGAFLISLVYVFAGVRFYMKIFVRKHIAADDCKMNKFTLGLTRASII